MSDTSRYLISILELLREFNITGRMALFAVALLTIPTLWADVAAADQIAFTGLSQSEQWVSEQLAEGRPADLSKYHGSKRRSLRSRFLQALLTGDKRFRIHRNGIQIDNADITGELNLAGAAVPYLVSITNSSFREKVYFNDSIFTQDLILDGSKFYKDADFSAIDVKRDASFQSTTTRETIFDGKTTFSAAKIGRDLIFQYPPSPSKNKKIIFNGQTDFSGAHIEHLFLAYGAYFNNSNNRVSDFQQVEFDVGKKDVDMLYQAISRDGYESKSSCQNKLACLNSLLKHTDLHEKIVAKKRLDLTPQIENLKLKF